MEGIMKYTVEIGHAQTYISCLIKTGSGIQKFMGSGGTHRHRQDGTRLKIYC
jgi:hypothetical protein